MFWVWLITAIIMAVVEAITPALVTIWFMFGAVAAMLTSAFGGNIVLQLIIFVTISTILLIITRPLAKRFLNQQKSTTNADRIIGETGIVTEEINNIENKGQIMVLGQCWSAKSASGDHIPCGEMVTIVSIEGVKAIVKIKED